MNEAPVEARYGNTKKRKYRSLNYQFSLLFIGGMLLTILSITILNGFLLEKYYLSKKVDVILDAINAMEQVDVENLSSVFHIEIDGNGKKTQHDSKDGSKEDSQSDAQKELVDQIGKGSSQNNLSWVVIDAGNSEAYNWGENQDFLRSRLFGYIYHLGNEPENREKIRETDTYTIQQVYDSFADMDYLEGWGQLENGYYFLIRTPLESIKESAAISNRFYFVVGIAVVILSTLLLTFFTKRLTRPIRELTHLSREMSSLHFEARYNSNVGNEIDVLGDSFNKMSDQLESTISELKSANLKLQKDIEAKVEMEERRKEFLDNVSHELKTPIALIQGYAEGLKENISEDQESREFYCDVIMDESAKMNKLVKNLLLLNQLESGNDAPVMERVDLVQVVKGVLQSMNIMIRQSEAQVDFNEEDPVYVWTDEFKTEEVVTNYVSNALHHLDGERRIKIRIIQETGHVRLSVFNTGKPIPEEDLPNLWNKFYKVDKARTREYGGSGIGLSIVKAIMEGMNQEYGVKNHENGVEFYITLDSSDVDQP